MLKRPTGNSTKEEMNQYLKQVVELDVPYMEKFQWDRLTLLPDRQYDSQFKPRAYFSGREKKKTPLVGLLGYLALTNCKDMISSNQSFVDVVDALQKNNFLALLYSLPNPFLDVPGRGGAGKVVATINGFFQAIILLPELLAYTIAIAISMAYRNCREGMNNPYNGWEFRTFAFVAWLAFGLLNIGGQAVFCVANALNYSRKLIDGLFNLSPSQVGKNVLRLLPVAIALALYFIPGLQPAGAAINAFSGKAVSLLSQGFSWLLNIGIIDTVIAAPATLAIGGLVLWQMTRNLGNRLISYIDKITTPEPIQKDIEKPVEENKEVSEDQTLSQNSSRKITKTLEESKIETNLIVLLDKDPRENPHKTKLELNKSMDDFIPSEAAPRPTYSKSSQAGASREEASHIGPEEKALSKAKIGTKKR